MQHEAEQHLGVDGATEAMRGRRRRVGLDRAPKVLIVDDEEDFLELTELFLQADGFRVVKAKSATEALWYALREPPDAIVLDLKLPGADGFQVLRVLRAEPETRDIPIFACSAADIRDQAALLAAGFDAHFPKPIHWSRLRELLRALLDRGERGER